MPMRFLLSAAVAVAASAPALSATPANWYVAQNVKTSTCIVTPTKPNGTTYVMIGSDRFPSVEAATASMRAAGECGAKSKTAASGAAASGPTTTASTAGSAAGTLAVSAAEFDTSTVVRYPPAPPPYDVFPDDDNIKDDQ